MSSDKKNEDELQIPKEIPQIHGAYPREIVVDHSHVISTRYKSVADIKKWQEDFSADSETDPIFVREGTELHGSKKVSKTLFFIEVRNHNHLTQLLKSGIVIRTFVYYGKQYTAGIIPE